MILYVDDIELKIKYIFRVDNEWMNMNEMYVLLMKFVAYECDKIRNIWRKQNIIKFENADEWCSLWLKLMMTIKWA